MPNHNEIRIRPDTHSFAIEWYKINSKTGEGSWVAKQWYAIPEQAARGILDNQYRQFDGALFDNECIGQLLVALACAKKFATDAIRELAKEQK